MKLAISTGVFSGEQASSVSQPSLSQGDSTKKVIDATGTQVQLATAEFVIEQHNIREQEWQLRPPVSFMK